MKVYTRQGDAGETSLIGGQKVAKDSLRIEAYGTIDELNANIGMLFNFSLDDSDRKMLNIVQNKLFVIGAFLACADKENYYNLTTTLTAISGKDINNLEKAIDTLQAVLPENKKFVLPVGSELASWCNISRTVCRRAERCIIALKRNDFVDANILMYINRLSDYLFVLGRKSLVVYKIEEIFWDNNI